jgi:hypothetical protein
MSVHKFSPLPHLSLALRQLNEVKEKILSYDIRIEKSKEQYSLDLKEIQNLKSNIHEQIHSVRQNIAAIGSMGCGWEDDTKDAIKECEEVKNICFKTFSRWSSIWPGLNLWLSSEGENNSSISALASQHGLIGEWVSLRAIACEIKVLSLCLSPSCPCPDFSHHIYLYLSHFTRASLTCPQNSKNLKQVPLKPSKLL